MKDRVSIRPYARLLTMLGDQLIKNEQIAVIELIKNAYDADADWVTVSFENFAENYNLLPESKIVIRDNGTGMTKRVIEKSWMNPATPNKVSKDGKELRTKKKHRIIQGEKGIGRYAMLKLGQTVELTTRPEKPVIKPGEAIIEDESPNEYSLKFDIAPYGDEFVSSTESDEQGLFLDELSFALETSSPRIFVNRDVLINNQLFEGILNVKGAQIEISNLRGSWNEAKIKAVTDSFLRFGNLFDEVLKPLDKRPDFTIGVFFNGAPFYGGKTTDDTKGKDITLRNLFETQSVLRVTNGKYDSSGQLLKFELNGNEKVLTVSDPLIRGTIAYKGHFFDKESKTFREVSNFGDFEFDFYIFDLNAREPSKYVITNGAKDIVRDHRIYLLRDDIRVLPYGDPDDDWLQIEVKRGTLRAGDYFSNDQVIGIIKITKFGNPHLRDKTNREGLIEDDNYTSDFICIIQSFLSYLRKNVYATYLQNNKKKVEIEQLKRKVVEKEINDLKAYFQDNKQAQDLLSQLEKSYKVEHKYLESRANQTESLAAVGLSVETASHDIMMMLNRGLDELRDLFNESQLDSFDSSCIVFELQKLLGIFSYVQNQMKDMQLLFTSSKQRRRQMRVKDIIDKVLAIYKRSIEKSKIKCTVNVIGSPLMAKCTDADLLQLFINLLDNAIYWLDQNTGEKQIEITLDGKRCELIFSDNGPGVNPEDAPYIFEPFYSGKGEDGRGLGLYISRKLMERNDYSISLADRGDEKILKGANFVVLFIKQEDNEY